MDLLNKFAPLKCKHLRANHSKFMTKELSKAIMLRTRFRHQFLKMKTPEAKEKYNKQRNNCVSLTGKAKKIYYESFYLNNICDNKKFWATVKPLFSNKIKSVENIVLSANGVLINIVTRNNMVWKLARCYCLCYCKTFFGSARLHRVHKDFCYRNVQYIICAT